MTLALLVRWEQRPLVPDKRNANQRDIATISPVPPLLL